MWVRATRNSVTNRGIELFKHDMLYKLVKKPNGDVVIVCETLNNNEQLVGTMGDNQFFPTYMFLSNFTHVYSEDHPILTDMKDYLQLTIDNFNHIPDFIATQVYKRIEDVLCGAIEYKTQEELAQAREELA